MKNVYHKIISLVMALVVLLSTTSFSVGLHYCGGKLVDSSFFSAADDCGMASMDLDDSEQLTTPCCSDELLVLEGQDELKLSFDNLNLEQQHFIAAFSYSYINLFEGLEENIIPFFGYPPPKLVKNIQLLDETFLI